MDKVASVIFEADAIVYSLKGSQTTSISSLLAR